MDMGMPSVPVIFRQLIPLARKARAWSLRKTRRGRPRDFPLSWAVRMPENLFRRFDPQNRTGLLVGQQVQQSIRALANIANPLA